MNSTPDSSIDPELLPVIENFANVSQASSKLSIAIYTVFVYNFIATLQDEVEIVWDKRWSLGLAIYFLTRYLAFVALSIDAIQIIIRVISLGGHQVSVTMQNISGHRYTDFEESTTPSRVPYYIGISVLCSAMVLLQLRTIALYGNPRSLFIWFGMLDLLLLGAFIVLSLFSNEFDPFMWIPLSCIELVTLLITLWKTYTSYRRTHETKLKLPLLLKVALRDNIFYLVTILVFYVGGTTLIFITEEFANPHFEASVAVSGVIAPLLYINLRKTQFIPSQEPTIPTMRFELHTISRDETHEGLMQDREMDLVSSSGSVEL